MWIPRTGGHCTATRRKSLATPSSLSSSLSNVWKMKPIDQSKLFESKLLVFKITFNRRQIVPRMRKIQKVDVNFEPFRQTSSILYHWDNFYRPWLHLCHHQVVQLKRFLVLVQKASTTVITLCSTHKGRDAVRARLEAEENFCTYFTAKNGILVSFSGLSLQSFSCDNHLIRSLMWPKTFDRMLRRKKNVWQQNFPTLTNLTALSTTTGKLKLIPS